MHADVPSESCDVCSRYYDIPTRTCTPILPACVATSYQTGMPSATSDRPCTPLTMCKAWEVVSVEGTATTDRTCAFNDVVCAIGEYEVSAPTATSTRGCRAVTKCTLEQYQTRAATPTSDVACSQATSCGFTTGACVWGGGSALPTSTQLYVSSVPTLPTPARSRLFTHTRPSLFILLDSTLTYASYAVACVHAECTGTVTGEGYRGARATTRLGVACAAWTDVRPELVASFPMAALDGAVCRNPDGRARPVRGREP